MFKKKLKKKENKRRSVDEVEERKENLKSVKSVKIKEKAWASRKCNKVIKEKVMVIIKKEKNSKIMENKRKSNS